MKFKLILLIFFFKFSFLYGVEKSVDQNNIYKNLRCLVCQGQSIAESNSDFAQTIKLVIRDQVNAGKSEEEIYNFLVEKYGEWIVYKPPLNKMNFLLWFIPYLSFFLGGVLIFLVIRKSKQN
jgi:cytochrome c-type biogenesis protein CcmH